MSLPLVEKGVMTMGFMMRIRPEVLLQIRKDFPPGATVEVIEFNDPYRKVPAGTRGKVLYVDDTGTIHCSFENGVSLGCLWGIDFIRRI